MTTTPSFTVTTTQIRRGDSIQLSISFDYTDSAILMPKQAMLQSLVDPAILQWWNSLTVLQRSALTGLQVNLRISGPSPS